MLRSAVKFSISRSPHTRETRRRQVYFLNRSPGWFWNSVRTGRGRNSANAHSTIRIYPEFMLIKEKLPLKKTQKLHSEASTRSRFAAASPILKYPEITFWGEKNK